MGYRNVLFPKASSAAHDAMVGSLARDHGLLVDVLRQAWPRVFDGVGNLQVTEMKIEYPVVIGEQQNDRRHRDKYVAGYIDLAVVVTMTRTCSAAVRYQEVFYLEVKSGALHLGELMRQINFYRTHKPGGRWVVVSPDDQHADLLRSQDVAFVRLGLEALDNLSGGAA